MLHLHFLGALVLLASRPSVQGPVTEVNEQLCRAVCRGDVVAVRKYIRAGIDINEVTWNGGQPIYWGIANSQPACVKELIGAGADLRQPLGFFEVPALHLAAAAGDFRVVLLLLKAELPLDSPDALGRTALHWAAARNREEAVRVLLKKGASPAAKDMYGFTPLHLAATCGALDVARILAAVDGLTRTRDKFGALPLHRAIAAGNATSLGLLEVPEDSAAVRTGLNLMEAVCQPNRTELSAVHVLEDADHPWGKQAESTDPCLDLRSVDGFLDDTLDFVAWPDGAVVSRREGTLSTGRITERDLGQLLFLLERLGFFGYAEPKYNPVPGHVGSFQVLFARSRGESAVRNISPQCWGKWEEEDIVYLAMMKAVLNGIECAESKVVWDEAQQPESFRGYGLR